MCSPADAGISTKSARQVYCSACSPAKSEILFSADVCLRGGKCFCFEVFAGNLFVTVRACKHFANFAGEISKTL